MISSSLNNVVKESHEKQNHISSDDNLLKMLYLAMMDIIKNGLVTARTETFKGRHDVLIKDKTRLYPSLVLSFLDIALLLFVFTLPGVRIEAVIKNILFQEKFIYCLRVWKEPIIRSQ